MQRGFTLLETIVTIGLLTILFLVGFQSETIMQTVLAGRGARQVESVLVTAAQRARNGVSGTNWGVYFDYNETSRVATRAIIFSGATYASRDTTKDTVFILGNSLKFTNVSFSGSIPSSGNDHEIDFVFLSGSTTQYGSITINNYAANTIIDIPVTGIPIIR